MRRSLIATSLTLGLTLFAAEAAAQRLPVPYVDRPLTLPEMTLRIDGDFPIYHVPSSDVGVGFSAGGGFGITDDFEVSARLLPVTFAPSPARFNDPVIGAVYRFLDEDTAQIGVGARIQIPVDDGRFFIFNPRLPVQLKFGDIVRFDTGFNFSIGAPTGGGDSVVALAGPGQYGPFGFFPPSIDPGIPAKFSFQVADPAWLGFGTGLGVLFTNSVSNNDAAVFAPLGFHGGGTIAIDGDKMIDIKGAFEFPLFVSNIDNDAVHADYWLINLGASFYLDL